MSVSRAVFWIIDGRDDGEEGSGNAFKGAFVSTECSVKPALTHRKPAEGDRIEVV